MKLEKRVLEIEYGEEKLTLKYPTVLQIKEMTKKQQKIKDPVDNVDIILDLLVELGMPKEIATELEQRHLESIMEVLIDSKK